MTLVPPTRRYDYVTDGLEIYRRSFGMIRGEADFRDFAPDLVTVATRIIHGAGDVDIVSALAATDDLVSRARAALEAGAPIFTDSHMLASGVTRRAPQSKLTRPQISASQSAMARMKVK